jgi:hypothetical protein
LWAFLSRTNGITVTEMAREMSLSRTTARHVLRTLRALGPVVSQRQLQGIVEVDEARIRTGGRDSIVLIASEIRDGKIVAVRATRTASTDADALTHFVSQTVRGGATVRTDHAPEYDGLAAAGYNRERRRFASPSDDPDAVSMGGPRVIATGINRWLLADHHGAVPIAELQPYLDEFCFRYPLRKSPVEVHHRLDEMLAALGHWHAPPRRRRFVLTGEATRSQRMARLNKAALQASNRGAEPRAGLSTAG